MQIPLLSREGVVRAIAFVDAGDWSELTRWSWCFHTGYAARRAPEGLLLMHRQIMGLPKGDPAQVDHMDHDRLNNCRANLRIVTQAEQQQNLPSMGGMSRFRGVSWDARNKKWRATVNFQGRQYSCGRHKDEVAAAMAAEKFRLEHMPCALPDPELARIVPARACA
jgi:hypothetical protein